MTRLQPVPSTLVPKRWPDALPYVLKALKYDGGRRTPKDIRDQLMKGQKQLWLAIGDRVEGVLITEIANYPQMRVCLCFLAAADELDVCLRHLPDVEAWAKENGCEMVELLGRLGWARVTDYRPAHVLLEKRI